MNKRILWVIVPIVLAVLMMGAMLAACDGQPAEIQTESGRYFKAHTFQNAATVTGTGTAMAVGGFSAVGVQVEGIVTGTISFQGTIDGSTWYGVRSVNLTDGTTATATTADGLWMVPVAGLDQLRANLSSYTSGTITARGVGVPNAPYIP